MDITRPIIALDLPSAEAALDFVGRFDGENLFVKVGMELFYACLLYTSPSPRDVEESRMPSSA